MTPKAIQELMQGNPWNVAGQEVWETSSEGSNAGNGSVMRCPPIAIPFVSDRERLAEISQMSSQITHADPRCLYGCAVLNLTIAGFLADEENPLSTAIDAVRTEAPEELVDALEPIASIEDVRTLQTSGYVIHTLQTALHDALRAESAEEAIVTAVNRGRDTDTIGAVAGAVAGARFGASDLSERWLDALDERDEIETLAEELTTIFPPIDSDGDDGAESDQNPSFSAEERHLHAIHERLSDPRLPPSDHGEAILDLLQTILDGEEVGSRFVEPLNRLLGRPTLSAEVAILRCLRHLATDNPEAVLAHHEAIITHVTVEGDEVTQAATGCCVELVDEDPAAFVDVVPALSELLDDDSTTIRRSAIYVIAKIAGEFPRRSDRLSPSCSRV